MTAYAQACRRQAVIRKACHVSEPDSTAPLEELPVFVYGTLRTGQDNYVRFLAGKTTRELPATLPDHSMYVAYGYPFVTDVFDGRAVIGDLMYLESTGYKSV